MYGSVRGTTHGSVSVWITNSLLIFSLCRENGLDDRVTLIKGKVEDVELPVDKVGGNHLGDTDDLAG